MIVPMWYHIPRIHNDSFTVVKGLILHTMQYRLNLTFMTFDTITSVQAAGARTM